MLDTMNAAQIIEEIQRLPEDERGKVLDFARHQPNAETLEAMREPTVTTFRVLRQSKTFLKSFATNAPTCS